MSTTLLLAALDYEGDLTGSEKLVLIILCNLSNDNKGNCAWPSHKYISRKSGLSEATVKRACKSLKEKEFITWVKGKYVDGKFKTNHYRINHSSLRAVVKRNQVSKRAIEKCHNDTHDSVTVSYNNLNNNLTHNLATIDKLFEENKNKLKSKQRDLVEYCTNSYISAENESFDSNRIKKYITVWLRLSQTQKLWDNFQNGLPSPIEKGWTKVLPRT
jgi:DNA-binding transcriptional regulator YhcF (GntR family)